MSYTTNGHSESPYQPAEDFVAGEAFTCEGLLYIRLSEGAICVGSFPPTADSQPGRGMNENDLARMVKCQPVSGMWQLALLGLG